MTKAREIYNFESATSLVGEVDRNEGIIHGVKVIELGRVNDGRPFTVDETTLEQVIELGNQPNKGIKVRLTHAQGPGSMGMHLGRSVQFRRDGNSVRSNITLAKSSFISPRGNIGEYVLTLAEEDAEAAGMSIAAILDVEAMQEAEKDGLLPLRIRKLYAVDVVSEPAATRGGMFEEIDMSKDVAPEAVVEETAPEAPVSAEMAATQEVVSEAEQAVESVNEALEASADHSEFVEVFGAQGAVWFLEGKSLLDCYKVSLSRAKEELDSLRSEMEEIQGKIELAAQAGGESSPAVPSVEITEEQLQEHESQMRELEARKRGIRPNVARAAAALAKIGQE